MASEAKSVPTFTYFNGRGYGEISRLLFAAAQVEFKDVRLVYGGDEWPVQKPKTPWGQLPTLEINGKLYGQSNAIQRYIARAHGLYGATDLETLAIDGIYEALCDTRKPFLEARGLKDEAEKKAAITKYFATTFPEWCTKLSATLAANGEGKGFFVGSKVSLADVAAYHTLAFSVETEATALDAFPLLAGLVARVAALPGVAAYLVKRPVSAW